MAKGNGPDKVKRSPGIDHAQSVATRAGDTRTYDEIETMRTGRIRPMDSGGLRRAGPIREKKREPITDRLEDAPSFKRGGVMRKAGPAKLHRGEHIQRKGKKRGKAGRE